VGSCLFLSNLIFFELKPQHFLCTYEIDMTTSGMDLPSLDGVSEQQTYQTYLVKGCSIRDICPKNTEQSPTSNEV
jgi:hypothetical protein